MRGQELGHRVKTGADWLTFGPGSERSMELFGGQAASVKRVRARLGESAETVRAGRKIGVGECGSDVQDQAGWAAKRWGKMLAKMVDRLLQSSEGKPGLIETP